MKFIGYFRQLPTGSGTSGLLFSEVKGEVDDTHIALFGDGVLDSFQTRIVAAANRYGDIIVVANRHHSPLMNAQLKVLLDAGVIDSLHTRDQGFIDNYGAYHSRKEALKIALAAGQINVVRPKTSPESELFSEDLY